MRLGLGIAVIVLALPGTALAERPPLPQSLSTGHFVVHYSVTPDDANATTPAVAAGFAQQAEVAYRNEVGVWGWTPPMNDGDGKTDIYVHHLTGPAAFTNPISSSSSAGQRAASIDIDPRAGTGGEVMAHEFFHVLQCTVQCFAATYLLEGTAEWAGHQLYPSTGGVLPFSQP
jgi:hypothetical protein